MKDKKRIEILLNVIERVYSKNPGIQTFIEESIIDIRKDEEVSPKQVFFLLFFAFLFLYRYGLSEQNIFVCEGELIISDDKKNII